MWKHLQTKWKTNREISRVSLRGGNQVYALLANLEEKYRQKLFNYYSKRYDEVRFVTIFLDTPMLFIRWKI